MKKIGKFIKSNTKLLVGIILGASVSGGAVYAATVLPSSQVGYDNSTSSLTATDVQGALDELNTKANTWIDASKDYSSSHLKINLKVRGPGDIEVMSSYFSNDNYPNTMYIDGEEQDVTRVVALPNDDIHIVTLYWNDEPSSMKNMFRNCSNILSIHFEETTRVASSYNGMFTGTSSLQTVEISNGWNNAGIVNALITQTDVKPTYIN